jgi:ERCC4-related helicase
MDTCTHACAGAGKTLIAAEVIRRKLPSLKAQCKAVLFMAPTNPLVAQVCVGGYLQIA